MKIQVALTVAAINVSLGCADTVRPVLGGLRIGVQPVTLQLPVIENEQLPFEYPRDAWKEGVGGETLLRIHITAIGTVDSVRVEQPSGQRSLDSAAVEGARRLRYRPALRGGKPMDVWATLPVRYPMPVKAKEESG